jgi:flagellar biosynthesis GTPase FlhF
MELKRILARDTRSATEQAMAMYGPDVLIISNNRVSGQTELVVALDVAAESATSVLNEEMPTVMPSVPVVAASPEKIEAKEASPSGTDNAFGDHLHVLLTRGAGVSAQASAPAEVAQVKAPVEVKKPAAKAAPVEKKKTVRKVAAPAAKKTPPPKLAPKEEFRADGQHEQIRSQEIVSLVREELAALRREFRLSQQTMGWESQQRWSEPIAPIVENLVQSAMPFELRTLLLDGLKEQNTFKQAMKSIRDTLMCNLKRPQAALPTAGVHVLAGPSGAGKTLMVARLAQQMALAEGAEKVAVVSFQDTRAGAWSQTQMLCAQSGVDSFRATDLDTLKLVLDELSSRQLVLIDTASVQMGERLLDVLKVLPTASLHAVVPADASAVTLKRVLLDSKMNWSSLMISKVDESSAPWALLQFLTQDATKLSLSVGSCSDRVAAGGMEMSPSVLVNLAIAQLTPAELSAQPTLSNPAELKRTPVARKTAQREIHG